MALFNFRHGLIVLLSLGRLIELRVAQRDVDRAVSHQLFEDFERDAGVEQLCREGGTQAVRRIALGDVGRLEILRHQTVDLKACERRAYPLVTWKEILTRLLVRPPSLQGLLNIR